MQTTHSTMVLSRAGARALDGEAAEILGIPSLLLMENAGAALSEEVRARLARDRSGDPVSFFCGPGSNGGDGYAAARRLIGGRRPVLAFALGEPPAATSDAGRNRAVLERAGVPVLPCPGGRDLARLLSRSSIAVDALFGTGLRRPIAGTALELVLALNASGRPVVAADLPSGLDADSGEVLGAAVRATSTITFAAPKRGLLLGAGPAHAGRIVVGDLGLPPRFVAAHLEPLGVARGRRRRQKTSTEVPESGTRS